MAENERLKHHHRRNLSSSGSSQFANASRARRAVEDGQYRKAIQSLSSDGLADATEDVFDEMLTKHPQADPPCIPSDPVPPSLQVREMDVVRALRSFPNGTAPGPSSFRANHFKEAVFCPSPDRANYALRGLVGVVNHLCAGRVPHVVLPHLCGASLFACKKKGGGHRPIAVGEVLRRLISKCVCWAVRANAIRILSPLQVGVGLPVGCKAIVHSVTSVQEDVSVPPDDRCTLLVDFSNAFNSVDREGMFRVVRGRIPSMAAWLECCYGSQPLLHLGECTILSCCGVQQGDPLGPLGFALALHPIIEKIKEEVPSLLTMPGTSMMELFVVQLVIFVLLIEFSNNPLPPSIPISRGGFDLLGSPIGPSSHCESSVLKQIQSIQTVLARLSDLQDSQMETTLLRSCLALPKIAFALRTCPPNLIQQALVAFDDSMREILSDLVGGPLSDWAWLKASLPSSLGGLNLRRAMFHAPAAYIASLQQSRSIISAILGRPPIAPLHLSHCVSALAEAAAKPEWSSLHDIDIPLHQRALSR